MEFLRVLLGNFHNSVLLASRIGRGETYSGIGYLWPARLDGLLHFDPLCETVKVSNFKRVHGLSPTAFDRRLERTLVRCLLDLIQPGLHNPS